MIPPPNYPPQKKSAFALLISLFLMAFLVVLVLTLSAIVQVELKKARQNILNQQARSAAKLAAYQALGEVQKALGPDQRITANASILDTKINDAFEFLESDESYAFWAYDYDFNRDNVESIEGISHPHWLGVWDSTPGYHPIAKTYDEDKEAHAERILAYASAFLVSGNNSIYRTSPLPEEESLLIYSPVNELTGDYINMLRKNSIADENGNYNSATMSVKVPLVTLEKTEAMKRRSYLETRIAWWVSDESQKAPVNAIASEDDFEYANEQMLQSIAFKNGIEALSLKETDTAIFNLDLNKEEDRNHLRSFNDLSQLDLLKSSSLPATVRPSKIFYNSLAIDTRSLAVNVREGGLKKDLSVGLLSLSPSTLEYDPNYFDRPMGVEGFDSYFKNEQDEYNTISNSLYTDNKGHMFGPQAAGNMDLTYVSGIDYTLNDISSTITTAIHKDPGGPLWDSLREYYNNRVTQEGADVYDSSLGYANKVRVKADTSTGLSPVLLNYQIFIYPALTNWGASQYGVRIYMVPIVVLWNPYDMDIAAGSTYAFRHGNGGLNFIGNFRVAIGIQSDGNFKCLRDLRTESIPRPIKNTEEYTASLASGSVELNEGDKDINFYRAVSFDDETGNKIISASADGVGLNKINKSFLGYGNWTEYDTETLVSQVEDNSNNPWFPTLVDFDDVSSASTTPAALTKGGLIRIYEKGTVSTLQGVSMPDYYKLSPDSFYYRKLYLNNVRYSLAWTGQVELSSGGGASALSDSDVLTLMEEHQDQNLRFLVRNENVLKGGEAKVFSLKESIPYHYEWNGDDGYAGNFGRAVSRGWYLTEGVSSESIGGFFIDMIHPESAHTASENDLGTAAYPTFNHETYQNQVFDPMNTETHDGKALGVLFDLDETNRALVYDDRDDESAVTGTATMPAISIEDIYIDFGTMNDYNITLADLRCITGPLGYIRVDASFNRNPWVEELYTATTLLDSKNNSNSETMPNHTLVYNEILMWNYADDADSHKLLLYKKEDVTAVEKEDIEDEDAEVVIDIGADGTGNIATDSAMDFQGLKRYTTQRSEASWHHFGSGTLSFPDAWVTENTGTYSYFNAVEGYAPFPNASSSDSYKSKLLNTITSDIFTTYTSTKDGETAYGISRTHSLDRGLASILGMTNIRRNAVRAIAKPVSESITPTTLYDVYYKNLMLEINCRIILANLSDVSSDTNSNGKITSMIYNGTIYSISSEDTTGYDNLLSALSQAGALPSSLYANTNDGYTSFLNAIGLNADYRDAIWAWEDPYFLLRDARRLSNPIWTTTKWESYYKPALIDQNDAQAWRDHVPFAFKSTNLIMSSSDSRGLTLSELTVKDSDGNGSLVMTEGINSYRAISEDIDSANEWQFQYPFKFPWLSQLNVSAKNFGDGRYGNAGTLRDINYGTDATRGTQLNDSPDTFYTWFARGDNLLTHTFFVSGTEGWQGNTMMNNLLTYYVDFGSENVQVGPDVMDTNGYAYNLKHYLRDYETVTSPADLASADLAFGADQSRNRGVGVGTADIIYPNYIMGSSYSSMKIAPERSYDYDWIDAYSYYESYGYVVLENNSYNKERDEREIRRIRYDIAWHLNDLLWDEYFFSTLPYRSGEQNLIDTSYGYLVPRNPRMEYINAQKEKIYSRISIEGEAISLNTQVKNTDELKYDFEANAARFWVKGAFNVNSTNVDAWKMVLGTSFGNKVYGYDSSESKADDKAPFPRSGLPYTAEEFASEFVRGNEKTAMQGFRALDREELEELALSVVENVKDRGPFFSLADFVNRAVELRSMETRRMGTELGYNTYDFSNDIWSDPENELEEIKINTDESVYGTFYLKQNHMQKGLLQSAIDLTSINKAFFESAYLVDYTDPKATLNARFATMEDAPDKAYSVVTKVKPSRYYTASIQATFWEKFGNPRDVWENYKASLGSTLAGAPAYLSQVDILKQIGSFITVRGDTFKIRAYGEVRNPLSAEIESKAWCEMLIQRYPEYIDSSRNTATDIDNRERELGYQGGRQEYDTLVEHFENSAVNKHLGRRFKILSFRWLSANEI